MTKRSTSKRSVSGASERGGWRGGGVFAYLPWSLCGVLLTGAVLVFALLPGGCGDAGPNPSFYPDGATPLERAFRAASGRCGLPPELLYAAAHIESRLLLGPGAAARPFGLALESSLSGADSAVAHVEAYGIWLGERMDERFGEAATRTPASGDDVWVEGAVQLSLAHYGDGPSQRVFAKELVQTLAGGFRLEAEGMRIVVPPRPQLGEANDPQMQLQTVASASPNEVAGARYVQLGAARHELDAGVRQTPRGITVVHCPHSLARCLAMQSEAAAQPDATLIGAHYWIGPRHAPDIPLLQTAAHSSVVSHQFRGQELPQMEQIVIALTGVSGAYDEYGRRYLAAPEWLSAHQLVQLHHAVENLCRTEGWGPLERCAERIRWTTGDRLGSIPDFDPDLFAHYVSAAALAPLSVRFELDELTVPYGRRVDVALNIAPGQAHYLSLEQLAYCSQQQRFVWLPLLHTALLDAPGLSLPLVLAQRGPNGDDHHYLRVVAKRDSLLTGWDLLHIQARGSASANSELLEALCSQAASRVPGRDS